MQAEVARAKGLDVIYLKPQITDFVPLGIDQFFDEHTIAVYLKERVPPIAKKGTINDMKLVKSATSHAASTNSGTSRRRSSNGQNGTRTDSSRSRSAASRSSRSAPCASRSHGGRSRTAWRSPPCAPSWTSRSTTTRNPTSSRNGSSPTREASSSPGLRRRKDHARPGDRDVPLRCRLCRQDHGSAPRTPGARPDHTVHHA